VAEYRKPSKTLFGREMMMAMHRGEDSDEED
jgi:hypothetical protein